MRALRGGVQRLSGDGRSTDGRHSREFQLAIIAQWGPLPRVANALLREAARLDLELLHAGRELDEARRRARRRDVARLRRAMVPMRTQLARLLEKIQELAASRPRGSFAAAVQAAGGSR